MKKILSTFFIGFFTILTCNYNIGLTIYIPIVIILGFNNRYFPLLALVGALFATYFFSLSLTLPLMLFTIIYYLFKYFKLKMYNVIILLSSFLNYFIYKDLQITLILSLSTIVLYLLLSLLIKSKYLIISNSGFITITLIFSTLGASTVSYQNINLGYPVALCSIMFLSNERRYFFSLFSSFLIAYLNYKTNINILILPLTAVTYFLNKTLNSIIFCGLVISLMSTGKIDVNYAQVTFLIIGIIEIFNSFSSPQIKNKLVHENIYLNYLNNLNGQFLNYISFLQEYSKNNLTNREYLENIELASYELVNNTCRKCSNKKCFANKQLIFKTFKYMFEGRTLETRSNKIMSYCPNNPIISRFIKENKIKINPNNEKENLLSLQISEFAKSINNYIIESTKKTKINPDLITNLYNNLNNSFNVIVFEIQKNYQKDFYFLIGITNKITVTQENKIILIVEKNIKEKVSLIKTEQTKNTTFYKLIPKLNLEISTGYSSVAKNGYSINGDSHLIKQMSNGNQIVALSDGMGHGISAHKESKSLITIIDKITSSNFDVNASISQINALFKLEKHLSHYATLDLINIDLKNGSSMFYKFGATNTYIVRKDGNIEKYLNNNLPLGILDNIETYQINLFEGDLVIVLTDGIIEKINNLNFEKFICTLKNKHSQKIAHEIINYSQIKQNYQNSDDMSVVVLKVDKIAS